MITREDYNHTMSSADLSGHVYVTQMHEAQTSEVSRAKNWTHSLARRAGIELRAQAMASSNMWTLPLASRRDVMSVEKPNHETIRPVGTTCR
jgi:hypothetical protein